MHHMVSCPFSFTGLSMREQMTPPAALRLCSMPS